MTDTTDREKHEWAAKAAGITLTPVEIKNVTKQGDDRFIGYQTDPDQWPRGWFDPLTDDGDALRLAARLKIQVAFGTFKDNVASAYKFCAPAVEVENTDIEAAAREAIFLMAAEIGKGMK